jgi:hypothetical protein
MPLIALDGPFHQFGEADPVALGNALHVGVSLGLYLRRELRVAIRGAFRPALFLRWRCVLRGLVTL